MLSADAGCGEGYYLRQLAAVTPVEQRLALLGLDISKWAVQSAAKQDPRPNWIVGSNANLPVLPGRFDRVLCMFDFCLCRVCPGTQAGWPVVTGRRDPDHLRELHEIIYPTLKAERIGDVQVPDGFKHLCTETVRYPFELTSKEQIADLLAMTPHLYRATVEGRARAAALTALSLTVDVRLTRFSRVALR